MLQVTDKDLIAHGVLTIDLLHQEDLVIDMRNVRVVYNTLTQCIFVCYKEMYKDDVDLQAAINHGKAQAFDTANNYRGFTFVIQPDVFTRFRNDLMTSLISYAIRHYHEAVGLPMDFKKQVREFPRFDLFERQALVVNEPLKSDVVFTSPRTTH